MVMLRLISTGVSGIISGLFKRHRGRLFWTTIWTGAISTLVGALTTSGVIPEELAKWIIAAIGIAGTSHNVGRALEDGLTKFKSQSPPDSTSPNME